MITCTNESGVDNLAEWMLTVGIKVDNLKQLGMDMMKTRNFHETQQNNLNNSITGKNKQTAIWWDLNNRLIGSSICIKCDSEL